jgi:hypothetical protein
MRRMHQNERAACAAFIPHAPHALNAPHPGGKRGACGGVRRIHHPANASQDFAGPHFESPYALGKISSHAAVLDRTSSREIHLAKVSADFRFSMGISRGISKRRMRTIGLFKSVSVSLWNECFLGGV